MNRVPAFGLITVLLLAGCGTSTTSRESAHRLPAPLIIAPPGTGFVLLVNGHFQLAPQIRLTAGDNGVLTANDNQLFISAGTLTIPPEARFLRLAPDGSVAVRNYQQDGYTSIGQLLFASRTQRTAEEAAAKPVAVIPGSGGVAPLEPALFAITRQGDRIRLVPVGYGG